MWMSSAARRPLVAHPHPRALSRRGRHARRSPVAAARATSEQRAASSESGVARCASPSTTRRPLTLTARGQFGRRSRKHQNDNNQASSTFDFSLSARRRSIDCRGASGAFQVQVRVRRRPPKTRHSPLPAGEPLAIQSGVTREKASAAGCKHNNENNNNNPADLPRKPPTKSNNVRVRTTIGAQFRLPLVIVGSPLGGAARLRNGAR